MKKFNEEKNTILQKKLTKGVKGIFRFILKNNKVYPTHFSDDGELLYQDFPVKYPLEFGLSDEEFFKIKYDLLNKTLHDPLKGKEVNLSKLKSHRFAKNYKPKPLKESKMSKYQTYLTEEKDRLTKSKEICSAIKAQTDDKEIIKMADGIISSIAKGVLTPEQSKWIYNTSTSMKK